MTGIAMASSEEAWAQVSFLFELEHSCSEGQPHP